MTAATSLRQGQIVRYNGSVRQSRGQLFRVNARYDCDGGAVFYDLSEWNWATPFDASDEITLASARLKSVEHVPADVAERAEFRTCGTCGALYATLPGEADRGCPLPDAWQHAG